ncbi:MAG: omptin family outer membrane protease [Treponema sp.]|nr:omptin family outer membrane protease [Treponema sp.]
MTKAARVFAAIFLTLCAAAPLSAQKSNGWKFNVEPVFGARLGFFKEIVWREKSTGGKYRLSQLDYDLLPAWYAGLNVGAQYKRFELNLLSKFFIPGKSGNLEDSDWQNDALYSDGDTSTKTDFSRHTLFLKSNGGLPGYELELAAAFDFYPTSSITLAPLLSFDAQYMSFKAKDGTGWYGKYNSATKKRAPYSDTSNREVVSFDGRDVLNYEVYNLFAWTGIRADFAPTSCVKLTLASEVALFWAMIDFDHHLTNQKQFIDITYSAFYAFRQTFKAEFKIKDFFSLCQKTSVLFTGESEGETYIRTGDSGDYKKSSNSKSGSQLVCVDLELSVKFYW